MEPERKALIRIDPPGTHIRHPPPPHELDSFITPDSQLFQTIHMGPAVVNVDVWRLVVTGLVRKPLSLSFSDLTSMKSDEVTAFHECYGPPTAKPIKNYWRIGKVTWTGVRLSTLLNMAGVLPDARYVWSDGLDHGEFAGHRSRKFQKDLTMEKALGDECLVAWKMNGKLLKKERGAPVRLVVPGWFGTNSTKWICMLDVRFKRAECRIFTTKFYNEVDPTDREGKRMRPVWEVEVNSLITRPRPGEVLSGSSVHIEGWCWGCDAAEVVEIGFEHGESTVQWVQAEVEEREQGRWNWQKFAWKGQLERGEYKAIARAKCKSGQMQPLQGRRNHTYAVQFRMEKEAGR